MNIWDGEEAGRGERERMIIDYIPSLSYIFQCCSIIICATKNTHSWRMQRIVKLTYSHVARGCPCNYRQA